MIDFRNSDGAITLDDQPEECFGESSFFDDGCYLPVGRRYRTADYEVVSRGALDLQNRDSLRTKTPLTPGQDVWAQVPLWTQDYTFLAGHRIGIVLVGTFRDYGTQAKTGPVPTYEVNVEQSRLTLPVVGRCGGARVLGVGAAPARAARVWPRRAAVDRWRAGERQRAALTGSRAAASQVEQRIAGGRRRAKRRLPERASRTRIDVMRPIGRKRRARGAHEPDLDVLRHARPGRILNAAVDVRRARGRHAPAR